MERWRIAYTYETDLWADKVHTYTEEINADSRERAIETFRFLHLPSAFILTVTRKGDDTPDYSKTSIAAG